MHARAIHEEMIARGFRPNRRNTESIRFDGHFTIRAKSVSVKIVFDEPNLTRLPKLFLLKRAEELPRAVAHIESQDRVCYAQDELFVLDPLKPRQSIALCIGKMEEALDRISALDLRDEICAEFPQHWLGGTIYTDFSNNFSGPAHIYELHSGTATNASLLSPNKVSLRRFGLSGQAYRKAVDTRISTFVLSIKSNLTFAENHRAPSTLDDLLKWMDWLEPTSSQRLLELISQLWPAHLYFFLNSTNGCVGGRLELPAALRRAIQRPKAVGRLLAAHAGKIVVTRLSGSRADADFVESRNMDHQPNLGNKAIALVGIGTIGGFLAKFLSQSGAGTRGGRFFLIDNQILTPGNVSRHFLGLRDVGKSKAVAMRDELLRLCPESNITALNVDAIAKLPDLLALDLLVDATGDQALAEVFDREIITARRSGQAPAIVHSWLVGNGIAARMLVVDDDHYACMRCLRLDQPDQERFRLIKPDHPARLTPANCGEGAYFAYGVGAPAIAAGLATQGCLDWVKGNPSPRFRTVRIVNEATFEVKDSNARRRNTCSLCSVN